MSNGPGLCFTTPLQHSCWMINYTHACRCTCTHCLCTQWSAFVCEDSHWMVPRCNMRLIHHIWHDTMFNKQPELLTELSLEKTPQQPWIFCGIEISVRLFLAKNVLCQHWSCYNLSQKPAQTGKGKVNCQERWKCKDEGPNEVKHQDDSANW